VGGSGERDHEILGLVAGLERRRLLHHAHFSAFQPVAGTPMEGRPPTPYMRELRLYQAEHLLRQYGFRFDELIFGSDGNLPLDHDPKTAWAARHPERFPLDVADAPYEALVRVPGIGSRAAWTLVGARRGAAIRGLGDLRRLGVDALRAGHFLALRGRRLATSPPPEQLRLFAHDAWFKDAAWKTTIPPCAFR
jgi:predicted DNA-binding helix-hairpin-helix protein